MSQPSNMNFQTIFNYAADPMFLLKDGHFIDANEATLKMFGVSSSNVFLAFHPAALSPEFQRDGQSSKLKADAMIALAYEKGFHRYEWVYVNLQGENFDAEVTLTKIEDNED
ncbi:PAS domain-containing protein, partial [Sulfurimonas sp. MAG313]